jgi:hypothetical protein
LPSLQSPHSRLLSGNRIFSHLVKRPKHISSQDIE